MGWYRTKRKRYNLTSSEKTAIREEVKILKEVVRDIESEKLSVSITYIYAKEGEQKVKDHTDFIERQMERMIKNGNESVEKIMKILDRSYIDKSMIKELEEMIRTEKRNNEIKDNIIL